MRKAGSNSGISQNEEIKAKRVKVTWLRSQKLLLVDLDIMQKSSDLNPKWSWADFLHLSPFFPPTLSQKTSQIMECIPGSPHPPPIASMSL